VELHYYMQKSLQHLCNDSKKLDYIASTKGQ